jgi:hypothetical protein
MILCKINKINFRLIFRICKNRRVYRIIKIKIEDKQSVHVSLKQTFWESFNEIYINLLNYLLLDYHF